MLEATKIAVPSENAFLRYVIEYASPPCHTVERSYIVQKYRLTIEAIYHEKVQPIHQV
jgi:hypothetical protein